MATTSPLNSAAPPKLPSPAILCVDKTGQVLSVNSSAELLWRCEPGALAGQAVGSLLALEGREQLPREEWEMLCGAALNQTAFCLTRTYVPGTSPVPVLARIEPASGEDRFFLSLTLQDSGQRSGSPVLVDSALALMADQGAVGFFDLNFKAEQVYYSPAWKRMLGYFETELANTYDSWLRLLHPEDSAAAPDHVSRKHARGVRSFSVEVRMLHRRGHYVWVHCLGTQIFGAHGDLERVTGLQIDITERKEMEELTLLNEERVQRLANEGDLALFDFNFASQEFWLSESWKSLTGASGATGAQALQSFVECLPPELAVQGAQSFFVEPSVGQPTFLKPLELRKSDGTAVQVLFGAHRQLSRKGDLQRAVGFCCPLPGPIAKPIATPIPAALIAPVLDTLSEAILLTDARGHIVYANDRALKLSGWSLEEALDQELESVFRLVEANSASPAPAAIDSALATGDETRLHGDHALINKLDGAARKIVWSARRLYAEEGQPRAVIVVFRDPEEMSLTPEELLRINRFETLGVVAGGISHDFNNLLTTILGGISQAKDNKDYNYLADSERACMAAKALTKQLLAIAKGGKAELVQTLNLADVLRDAVRLARAGTNAVIRIELPDTIKPVSVDRAQILQVFQNLIINAIQAMPARGGALGLIGTNCELAAQQIGTLPAGPYVQVEVRDNGCGIAPEHLEKIFEPFFTTKKHGTGLGLSMVRSLVRKYGGDVAVSSTVGKGTSFFVYLPEATGPAEMHPARQAPSLRFGTGRILLMDDDPDICRLAEGMLASLDYKYDIVRHGEEAVAQYRRYLNVGRPYDAVILDLTVVGGAGGEETFHQLRALDPQVRAIVCSGYDSEEMIHHYMSMGFAGYLTKPFRVGDLGKVLKTVVG